jgi:hypothetical protein
MKTLLLFLTLIPAIRLYAQPGSPAVQSAPDFSFSEVIIEDSLNAAALYSFLHHWLDAHKYSIVPQGTDSLAGRLQAHHGFPVYARGYLTKRIHGKITYTTTLEVKDGKYCYTFSDFVFAYYKEDRTHKMIPSGKTKALREMQAPGWQALWEEHKQTAAAVAQQTIADLKKYVDTAIEARKAVATTNPARKADW